MLLLECIAKDAFTGKTCAEAYLFDGQIRIFQQVSRGCHAAIDKVLMWRVASLLFEYADEAARTEPCLLCQQIDLYIFVKVLTNVLYTTVDDVCVSVRTSVARCAEQK